MASKPVGKILYPLIVSDIYGVILYDGSLNDDYLIFLKKLSIERRIVCYSSMSHSQLETLKDNDKLSMIDKYYSSINYNWPKHSPESYKLLADEEQVSTSDIIFIDDNSGNVAAANAAGCAGLLYNSASRLSKDMLNLGVTL